MRAIRISFLTAALTALPCAWALSGGVYVNAQLPWHEAVLDSGGRLLAWHQPEKNRGYDRVLRLGWEFIKHKVPADTAHGTGLKVYLIGPVFHAQTLQNFNWQHNAAMLYASFVDSLAGWYAYSGDEEAVAAVRGMLDHHVDRGMTPADWAWPEVPFSVGCAGKADYGHCIQNMPRGFYGGIETDKVGELGFAFTQFFEMTGERKYLEAALRCGRALARHVRPGTAERTPWPYRVDARTGVTLAREEFGGNTVACVRLFDELIRLGEGETPEFRKARDLAWRWLREYPMNPRSPVFNHWTGYFEDMAYGPDNLNQVTPMAVARYMLERDDPASVEPRWSERAGLLIDFVRKRFGRGPFFGAWAIDEQNTAKGEGCCSRAGLSSHTARWAAVNALYYEKTNDGQAREDAFRSLNYATYFAAPDGRISCCGNDFLRQYWFSDGYGDYFRHFHVAMGAMPELAPAGESHLLRSSSLVQKVTYGSRAVAWRTFDESSRQVLRLNFRPGRVTAGGVLLAERRDEDGEGYTVTALPGGDFMVRVRQARSREVSIAAE